MSQYPKRDQVVRALQEGDYLTAQQGIPAAFQEALDALVEADDSKPDDLSGTT